MQDDYQYIASAIQQQRQESSQSSSKMEENYHCPGAENLKAQNDVTDNRKNNNVDADYFLLYKFIYVTAARDFQNSIKVEFLGSCYHQLII